MALEVWVMCRYGIGNPVISRGWMVQWVLVNGKELGSLVGDLGCTALMRANSPKHSSGCLQFAKNDVNSS